MILLLPFLILISVLGIGVSIVILIIAGFFGGIFIILHTCSINCFICVTLALPVAGVVGAVVALVGGIWFYVAPFIFIFFC